MGPDSYGRQTKKVHVVAASVLGLLCSDAVLEEVLGLDLFSVTYGGASCASHQMLT